MVLGFQALGFRVLGFRVLGFRALGFRVLGFRVLGFRVLGFQVLVLFPDSGLPGCMPADAPQAGLSSNRCFGYAG